MTDMGGGQARRPAPPQRELVTDAMIITVRRWFEDEPLEVTVHDSQFAQWVAVELTRDQARDLAAILQEMAQ